MTDRTDGSRSAATRARARVARPCIYPDCAGAMNRDRARGCLRCSECGALVSINEVWS